jgi:hypothetical protein
MLLNILISDEKEMNERHRRQMLIWETRENQANTRQLKALHGNDRILVDTHVSRDDSQR